MASVNSDQYADAVATPTVIRKPTDHTGRVRVAFASYLTDASAAPVAGDTLNLFKLPAGARVLSMVALVPAGFVTSSAKIGITGDDDRYGSGLDLSAIGRKEFITVAADAMYVTTAEVAVFMTFTTGDPNEAAQIAVICEYVLD